MSLSVFISILINILIGLLGFFIPSRLELQFTEEERNDIWGNRNNSKPIRSFNLVTIFLFFKNMIIISLLFFAIVFLKIYIVDYLNLNQSERNIGDCFMIVTIILSYFIRYKIFKSKL